MFLLEHSRDEKDDGDEADVGEKERLAGHGFGHGRREGVATQFKAVDDGQLRDARHREENGKPLLGQQKPNQRRDHEPGG